MHIYWLGGPTVKIVTKDTTILFDPRKTSWGASSNKVKADLVLSSNPEEAVHAMGEPQVFNQPGEYEFRGILCEGIASATTENQKDRLNVIYTCRIEGVMIGHLGEITTQTFDKIIEEIGSVDVLFVPAGSPNLSPRQVSELVDAIDPRLVIPVLYKSGGTKGLNDPAAVLRELGGSKETLPKLLLKSKDLPTDKRKVITLTKS